MNSNDPIKDVIRVSVLCFRFRACSRKERPNVGGAAVVHPHLYTSVIGDMLSRFRNVLWTCINRFVLILQFGRTDVAAVGGVSDSLVFSEEL